MKAFKILLLAIGFCLIVSLPAHAEYSHVGGGIYQNSEGALYKKVWVNKQVDCGYGRYCVQRTWSWQAVSQGYAKGDTKVNIYNVSPSTKNWRDVVASYAGAIKLEQQNHQDFVATMDALGLAQGNAYVQQYGQQGYGQQGYGQQGYQGYYAPQGETNYQLRYSTLSSITHRADPAIAINQVSNHIRGLQDLLKESNSNLQATVQMDVVGRNAAANTVANAMAAAYATDSLANLVDVIGKSDQGSNLTVREVHTAIEAIKNMNKQVPQVPEGGVQVQQFSEIRHSCVRCHSGDDAKGGLSLDGSQPLNIDQYKAIIRHTTKRTMPPPEAVDEPLTSEQIDAVLQEADSFQINAG